MGPCIVGDDHCLARLVDIALAGTGGIVIARHHSFLQASAGEQNAAVGLEDILVVIEGVQVALAVCDALFLTGLLISGTHYINKVV